MKVHNKILFYIFGSGIILFAIKKTLYINQNKSDFNITSMNRIQIPHIISGGEVDMKSNKDGTIVTIENEGEPFDSKIGGVEYNRKKKITIINGKVYDE